MSQTQLQQAVKDFEALRGELQAHRVSLSALTTQHHENEQVLKELDVLEDDAVIFKLIGPVLVKQSKIDARSMVSDRLEYIKGEMERADKLVTELQNKFKECARRVEASKQQLLTAQQRTAET